MKLIYIKSTMEPKNYSTIRSILKRERGEKIAPYIFKISDTKAIKEYLDKERITFEIYQETTIAELRAPEGKCSMRVCRASLETSYATLT